MVCLARRNYPSSSRQGVKSSSRQVVKSSNRQDFGLWVLSSRLPPEINITFWGAGEIEIDPQQDWVMIEARNGYYEAYRHPLCSLQKLAHEKYATWSVDKED